MKLLLIVLLASTAVTACSAPTAEEPIGREQDTVSLARVIHEATLTIDSDIPLQLCHRRRRPRRAWGPAG